MLNKYFINEIYSIIFAKQTKTNTMKKVLLAVAVVALFASCKKDYTCTCNYGGAGTYVRTYSSVSGSNANYLQADCESTTTTNGSVDSSVCVWDKK
jgi:hypothetical protein